MSRITKQIAESTAKALVQSKKAENNVLEKEFKYMILNEILKDIPKEILDFNKKHPRFVKRTTTVQISGNGWDFQTVYLDEEIPSPNGNKIQLVPNEELSVLLLKRFTDFTHKKELVKKLEQDLGITIFNLRTYKSVQENFPEAFELLPKIVNNSVQLNLSDILNRIK
jgi:uncharacterized protein (DUF4213/DUF364 family)